jgi:hypothetical protein
MQVRIGLIATVVAAVFGSLCSTAFAVTPGWECVPTTAGQAVTSGGTGTSPSCRSSSTAVLAPTYVATGVGGVATAQFSGVNVQVVNGTTSEKQVNSEGNLIIGYDPPTPGTKQTGSHNLVLDPSTQSYTSYGGIVAGSTNTISGPDASVLSGQNNGASGPDSSVSGGQNNQTIGDYSSISGGGANTAYANSASVSGGGGNIVGAKSSSVGYEGSISGGTSNTVTNQAGSISGGESNTASGEDSSVSGGYNNAASQSQSSVTGGAYNVASDLFASIAGGCDNLAGPGTTPTNACSSTGIETVSGGAGNAASGPVSSISGGTSNIAGGPGSSASPIFRTTKWLGVLAYARARVV